MLFHRKAALIEDKNARKTALKYAPALSIEAEEAFIIYSKMGRQLDWSALPIIIDVYEVSDVSALIDRLEAIVEAQRESIENADT